MARGRHRWGKIMGFQFGNRFGETKLFDLEDTETYISGSTAAVSAEFKAAIGGAGTFREQALPKLLAEIVSGDGVESVSVQRVTGDSITLAFENRGQVDTAIFENAGDLLDGLSGSFQFGNRGAQFKIVEAGSGEYISGSTAAVSAELNELVGGTFRAGGELDELVTELLEGDGVDGVTLLGLTADSIGLGFANRGVVDTLVVRGASDLLSGLDDDFQFRNPASHFKIVEAGGRDCISGSTGAVSAELNDIVGGTFRAGDGLDALLDELVNGDGVEGVTLTDFSEANDTAVLRFESAGAIDTLLVTGTEFDFA